MFGRGARGIWGLLLGLGIAGLAVVGACAESKGALMLAINTDMKAPKDVNAVSVTISTNGAIKHSFIGRVTPQGDVIMPATIAVVEPDDANATVRVRVMAFQEQKPRVLRDIRTTIPKSGRVALLRIPLNFVNDKSAVGADLPAGVLPVSATANPTGSSSGSSGGSVGASDFDFFGAFQPPCPDILNQTVINGECKDSYIDPATLPDFDRAAIHESTSADSCFDVAKCFAQATPITTALDRQTCSLPIEGDPSKLNIALVTSDTGECLQSGECYIPLDRGPTGFDVANGRATLPPYLCKLLDGHALKLASSSGGCAGKQPDSAICAPKAGDPSASGCGVGNADAAGATTASKVDILFVVGSSPSMAEKAKLLASSVAPLLEQAAKTNDVHVGVISTALGGFGGDICSDTGRQNDHAHLLSQRADGSIVTSAKSGVLAFGAAAGGGTDVAALVTDVSDVIAGVGEGGCGFEAQLESTYHFLGAPDPWTRVTRDAANQADYGSASDVDTALLQQRAAFLRPDSLLLVVMLTDEDDSTVDPLALGGQGWAFMNNQFPGSVVFRADGKTTTAPRATSACATNPGSPDCTSCAFANTCNPSDAACQKIKNDPECQKNGGYYGPGEDALNVRFQRMKERYGVDPQYPLSRYVDALTKKNVPSRANEHPTKTRANGQGRDIGAYCEQATCTNPIFAGALPVSAGDELCKLPVGPRGKELVVFALIGGVPEQLVHLDPNDVNKSRITESDWRLITGADQAKYDYSGIDPHMIPSKIPRASLPPPTATRGDNGSDPVHGREWETAGNDLQYACTFALGAPRTCLASDPSCDCATATTNPPLCGAQLGQQLKAKAYPTSRELLVARSLGDRGIPGSICASPPAGMPGYSGMMKMVADRIAPQLVAKP